jgi:organizing structure protein 2
LNSWINTTQNTIDSWAEAFHTKEQHFTSTIANLHHRDEDLLTSGIYVLVAGLSGTILTRRSNFLLKGVVPLVFGTLAFKYVLPRTFSNTADFAHDIETVKAPGLAKKQDELIKDVGLLISQTESKAKDVELVTESKLKSLKDSFKKYTGLRVDEDVTK